MCILLLSEISPYLKMMSNLDDNVLEYKFIFKKV